MENGIGQEDLPLLFNLIMGEVNGSMRRLAGYHLERETINILCYADDTGRCSVRPGGTGQVIKV